MRTAGRRGWFEGLRVGRTATADDAVTSYERAIGIKSDHPAAYQGLSETLEAKGDVEGRLRATRLSSGRHAGRAVRLKSIMPREKACAYAWKHRAWTRVVEFCGELRRYARQTSRARTKRRAWNR